MTTPARTRYWQGLSFNITDRTMAELEATRRLAALDELRNSMLTAISHELGTPLAGILGASVASRRRNETPGHKSAHLRRRYGWIETRWSVSSRSC
jgi:K+-sensing histidine kinase KdpD